MGDTTCVSVGTGVGECQAAVRIRELLDTGSFVEVGHSVTARATDFNMQAKKMPGDGVITGYGVIDGNLVYVYSQDATVLNGTIGEMHAKKIVHIYELAMKTGAPVIGLIECAGIRLQEATDALHGFGSLYMKQVIASGVIPQITALFGTCGGGLAVIPGLSDFTFMEKSKARLFVNSPNTILGNHVSTCDTAQAKFQSEKTGMIDGVGTQEEILEEIRMLICMIPANNEDDASYDECRDKLNRVCEDAQYIYEDVTKLLELVSDEHVFFEVKREYAKEMVVGFIRLNGMTVGAVANRTKIEGEDGVLEEFDGTLTPHGCEKAARFVRFCDAFGIPIASFTNVCGYHISKCAEKRMAREAAKLIYEFANATVPKVNMIVGKAYGTAYVAMNSQAIGADAVYAWTTSKIGMMDETLAAKIMYTDAEEDKEIQSGTESAVRRGYVDCIIEPKDTRKHLIGAFEMLFTKQEDRPSKKHGTV